MLRQQLSNALKEALKSKDQAAVSTLRLILAALKDRDIAARGSGNHEGIGEPEIFEMLQKMVRQRRDSIELFEKGDRPDLVAKEQTEIGIIERFLPKQMTEEEMAGAIGAVIEDLEANTIKDMGRVMAEVKSRYSGRMDFGKASGLVKQRLSS